MTATFQRGIIFDWIGTLYEHNHGQAEHAEAMLDLLSGAYSLSLISLSKDIPAREKEITSSGLRPYFKHIIVARQKLPEQYEKCMEVMGTTAQTTWIVDDRTKRGIAIGTKLGCKTIWLQNGEYAHELPDATTGKPTKVIHNLQELTSILT